MKFNFHDFKEWLIVQLHERPDLYTEGAINNVLNKIREGERELQEMQKDAEKKRVPYWHETHDLFKELLGE